jgi:hypothetical protein
MIKIGTKDGMIDCVMNGSEKQLVDELSYALSALVQCAGARMHAEQECGTAAEWEDVVIRDIVERTRKRIRKERMAVLQ